MRAFVFATPFFFFLFLLLSFLVRFLCVCVFVCSGRDRVTALANVMFAKSASRSSACRIVPVDVAMRVWYGVCDVWLVIFTTSIRRASYSAARRDLLGRGGQTKPHPPARKHRHF